MKSLLFEIEISVNKEVRDLSKFSKFVLLFSVLDVNLKPIEVNLIEDGRWVVKKMGADILT
jgi:hypothetical protein